MTVERRAAIRQEITDTLKVISIVDVVAGHLVRDPDLEELQAVHLLLARGIERVDRLLLAMSADRLTDERDGSAAD